MNWQFDDALKTADKHAFFKYMVKSIAEKHGLRATFMPKPFPTLTGNGCHVHVSLWSKDGKNLFEDPKDPMGLSKLGYQFIAGVMHSAEALTAITNPTVNSYKRINAPRTLSGATWAPNTVTYTGNNRTHMIRIPDAGRFELRLGDGAANPYAMQAAVLIAGLDGIENKRDPGDAARYRHVRRRAHGEGRQEAATQSARCFTRARGFADLAQRLGRTLHLRISEAQTCRLGRVRRAAHRVGAAYDARLLRNRSTASGLVLCSWSRQRLFLK